MQTRPAPISVIPGGPVGSPRPDVLPIRMTLGGGGAALLIALFAMALEGIVTARLLPGWQPVPVGTPTAVAVVHSCILCALAAVAFAGWGRLLALRCLFALSLGWILLHVPAIAGAPVAVVQWLGVAEVGAVSIGLWLLTTAGYGPNAARSFARARIAYGFCALIFGASHFAYAQFTATMVPAWLGHGVFWAYATGAAHLAAGVSMLSGRRVRLSAALLALMMGSFVVLVHVPRVMAQPGDAAEVGFLICAVALTGSAWIMAERARSLAQGLPGRGRCVRPREAVSGL